ncbi:NAD(+)/NADH kinase [Halobellus captivus]|uniref:NAD(+)/NADH kinase n=1 Tax=Halobellus captivus TaxID=2592614 RepID=UPI001EF124E4|nr:NAD(+)/NADH kinase [Halobellus captivus]
MRSDEETPVSLRCLVVGDDGSTDGVTDALGARDDVREDVVAIREIVESGDETTGVDAVFAVGFEALSALASRRVDCPIVPLGVDSGRYDIAGGDMTAVVDALREDVFEIARHPVLDVDVDGESAGYAVADVTLMTADPARISEYSVSTADRWTETVRSDGVVVATPLGSTGYARAVGGPVLAPETGLVCLPVSPYAMNPDAWVLREPITLSVERDEADVSLHFDDEVVRSVPTNVPVTVSVARELSLVRPQLSEDD